MKTIAENHITITKELFYEGMKATESASYKKMVKRLAILLAVLFTAAAIWLLLHHTSLVFLLGEAIFLLALFFWLCVMLPGSRRKNKYKALTASSDAPSRTILFYEDHLCVQADSGKTTDFPYVSIEECIQTPHLYILVDRDKKGILLDPKGFVQGDLETVRALLSAAKEPLLSAGTSV